jgi:hypothetical protein
MKKMKRRRRRLRKRKRNDRTAGANLDRALGGPSETRGRVGPV